MHITWGAIYWPAFLIGTGIALAIPEFYALYTNPRNTLSDYAWAEEPGKYSWLWYISLILWLVFATWITGHIWWQIWRKVDVNSLVSLITAITSLIIAIGGTWAAFKGRQVAQNVSNKVDATNTTVQENTASIESATNKIDAVHEIVVENGNGKH